MLQWRVVAWMFSAGVVFLCVGVVSGQTYPNKPIRVITSGLGGTSDFVSRLIAQGLTSGLGQQAIVDNKGSFGNIQGQTVAQALPDGYTLLIDGASHWLLPFMQKVGYDPVKDFVPVSPTNRVTNILVVHPAVPVNTVKELIVLAKAKPGELNVASGGTGGISHLAVELFKVMAGVNMVRVPYKSGASKMVDLLGGQVQLTFGTASETLQHVKAGRLRALAVTSSQPSEMLPGFPTVAASGLPGYEAVSITGMFAPAGTPPAIVNRLSQEIARIVNAAEVKERFAISGIEPFSSSPEQFGIAVKSEMAKWGKVIKEAGIRAD